MGGQKIKLCGMMREVDIDFANEAMPDYVGFIFADTRRKISKSQAVSFRERLNQKILAVGVFVDEAVETVAELLKDGCIDIAQLHGKENAEYILRLKELVDKPVIKAVKVTNEQDILETAKLPAKYLLLDTYRKGVLGGTGESFEWNLIDEAKKAYEGEDLPGQIGGKPYFLAGGLDRNNIEKAAKIGAYGLDVSTGIETDGFKDREKMIEIVRRIRNV